MSAKPKKKRNPQDTTLRNVRAANAKIDTLFERLGQLEVKVHDLTIRVNGLSPSDGIPPAETVPGEPWR